MGGSENGGNVSTIRVGGGIYGVNVPTMDVPTMGKEVVASLQSMCMPAPSLLGEDNALLMDGGAGTGTSKSGGMYTSTSPEVSIRPTPTTDTICDRLQKQFNVSRHKIVFGGLTYKCNKVKGQPVKGTSIIKYYQCSMVLASSAGATWQPAHSSNGSTGFKHITYMKCNGTLKATVSSFRGVEKNNFEPGQTSHICYNPSWAYGGDKDKHEPLMMVLPSIHCNLTDAIICNVKLSLQNIVSGWEPLGHCGSSRQYLKELLTNKNMTHIKKQVEAIIHPVVKSVVTSHYQSLTQIKVGALHSRGNSSQYNMVGSMHRDYHDDVNRRVPNERPQSIILALDPFNFLYEQNAGGGKVHQNVIVVPRGNAVIFTSALNHAGGNNISYVPGQDTSVYLYRLFAYILSDVSDFPSANTPKVKLPEAGEVGNADDVTISQNAIISSGHTKKGRERVQTKTLTYDEHGKSIG